MVRKKSLYTKVLVLSVLCLPVLLVSAGISKPYAEGETPKGSPGSSAAGNGGTITGVVRFSDTYPEREKITITKDHAICGAFQYSEEFVVSEKGHGLKNVVVSLLGTGETIKASSESVATLEQRGCRYVPHVQAVPAGTVLEIVNSDGILHNVHAFTMDPKKTFFNKAQPKFLKKLKQPLDKPGIYFFGCDIHAHMSAFIAVMEQPFYTVTDDNGSYSMAAVPAGNYKVLAWHEALGSLEKTVTVQPGKTSKVVFEILPNQ